MKTLLDIDWANRSVCVKQLESPKPAPREFEITIAGTTVKGHKMKVSLPIGKFAQIRFAPTDLLKNSTSVENPVFEVSDPAILSIQIFKGDVFITPQALGSAVVTVKADTLLGPGEHLLTDNTLEIDVIPGEAVALNVAADIIENLPDGAFVPADVIPAVAEAPVAEAPVAEAPVAEAPVADAPQDTLSA